MPALRTLAAEALRAQPNRVFGFDLLRVAAILIKLVLLPLLQAVLMPALEPAGWLVAYAPYWGLLLGGALLLYSYVEVPFMNLRGAFEKPRKAAVSPAEHYATARH